MDAAEPPRIVIESSASCADSSRAGELLRQTLAQARAPSHAWVVTMRIEPAAAGELRAEGEIKNGDLAPVGHRTFTGKVSDCRGLERAIGVWASLVLEGEVNRSRSTVSASNELAAVSGQSGEAIDSAAKANARPIASAELRSPPAEISPNQEPDEKRSRRDEPRTLELGVGAFLMAGTGGVLIGATPFVVVEVAKGFFLRPAIALGGSVVATQSDMMFAAGRLDGCVRAVGLYPSFQGLQFDLCGGVDAGMQDASGQTIPYLAVGPSMDMRGELGDGLGVILRGLFDVHVLRDPSMDPVAGRGELAFSWILQ